MSDHQPSGPDSTSKVEELEARLHDLRSRLPAHSIPASMLIELEELEEMLERAQASREAGNPP